jgi:5'-methylthioadenosine phosphorylase
VIGMTNLGEAKLAREAEIAFATLSMVTDYDCWRAEEEPVTAQTVISHLLHNAATAKELLARVIPCLPTVADWPEHCALDNALATDKALWPPATVAKMGVLLERFF